MITVLEVIKKSTEFFTARNLDNPRLNAELIVGHALKLKRMQLYVQFERILTEPELEMIRPLVRRRSQREPVQYVLGETEWHGMKLKVDRRALIPRPETEYLLERVLGAVQTPPARILDLGTGSGALALALANAYPEARVIAIDLSEEALSLSRENAASLGLVERVDFRLSDWFSAIEGEMPFQLIIANPPYLSESETAEAAPEVRNFEPNAALTAGENGLADLRKIIGAAPHFLEPGGLLAMETGIQQHSLVSKFCSEAGFVRTESIRDLAGRDRYVLAWR